MPSFVHVPIAISEELKQTYRIALYILNYKEPLIVDRFIIMFMYQIYLLSIRLPHLVRGKRVKLATADNRV